MDLVQLQYFLAVAKYETFTRAARATYTSQPNISKQIFHLEEELGCQLFLRSNAGASLTPAGKRLYEGLSELLPRMERLFDEARGLEHAPDVARISLGLCESMDLERIIPGFFSTLLQTMTPEIQIQIETHPFDQLLEKLLVGNLDCVFLFSTIETDLQNVARMPLSRANPMLYYSKRHPAAARPNPVITDFSDATFVCCPRSQKVGEQYRVLPFQPVKIEEANSVNAAFQYIESGKAVGVFGPSQNRLGKEGVHTIELPTEDKVGTDALWLEGSSNPVLEPFLAFLFRQAGRSS